MIRALPLLLCLASTIASAADPAGAKLLAEADAIVAPASYEAEVEMTAYRPDGTNKQYVYRSYKQGTDRMRLTFVEPATMRGHEALRRGDDLFRYVPSLRRALRVASRDDFEAGDFRQADVLRVNLPQDYDVQSSKTEGDEIVLELTAKSPQAAYDKIRYHIRAKDHAPLSQEFFTEAGKKLRTLQFSDYADLGGGVQRPTTLKMSNEVAAGRYTIIKIRSLQPKDTIPESQFQLEALGR